MAKKSSKSGGRGHTQTARRQSAPPSFLGSSPILNLSDRRLYHPEGFFRPAIAQPKVAARIIGGPGKSQAGRKLHSLSHEKLTFAVPDKVAICVRRKRRKEVMFAKNKAGKSGQKRPKRNYWSSISCKR